MSSGHVVISATNRGPLISFVTWVLLVVMCLAVVTKVYAKIRKIKSVQLDDLFVVAAMVSLHPTLRIARYERHTSSFRPSARR